MKVSVHELQWLRSHAERDQEGLWFCRETKNLIQCFCEPQFIQSPDHLGGIIPIAFIGKFLCPSRGHHQLIIEGTSVPEQHIIEI